MLFVDIDVWWMGGMGNLRSLFWIMYNVFRLIVLVVELVV